VYVAAETYNKNIPMKITLEKKGGGTFYEEDPK
jgi:hypothetical protein